MIMTEQEIQIVNAMEKYGGSFVKALATTCRLADEDNLWRIRHAFPEIWANYTGIAETLELKR
jgi:phage gp37-like protein